VRAELIVVALVVAACGPAKILTRTEGDGGWSPDQRQSELSARATAAHVDLAPDSTMLHAESTAPLTLADVVGLAAVESRRVAEADRDVATAATRVQDARGRYFPVITGQGRYNWFTDAQRSNVSFPPGFLPPGVTPPGVTIRQKQYGTIGGAATVSIDLWGEITKGLTAAQAGYRAEEARRFGTLLGEQLTAVTSYFDMLEAERLRDVSEQSLAAQRTQLANAQSRFDAGRLTKNELLVVQVAVRNSEQVLRQQDLQRDRARWALNQVIGRPVDAPTRVADVTAEPLLPSETDALREAYAHNPVLLALVEEQQRLEDTRTALVRSRLPQVQGGGTIDYSTSDIVQPQRVGSGFVGFTWTFDTGGRKDAQIEEARLAADQNRVRIEQSLREVETAVRSTHHAATERLAALATAETAVHQAEENLRIRTQQFDVGRATSEDVLDATTLLAQQRAILASALYEAHTRRAELQQVMGLPLDTIVPGPR
jgi:outer membrane protein TolC